MSRRPGLWGHADFLRLWGAQAISAFGSRITRTALPIIAVEMLREPPAVLGVLAALPLVASVIVALFAGGFVDRSYKRRVLITADLFRAAVVASLTIAWALGALSIVHVIGVAVLVGAASALDQITDVAYLPVLVDKRWLADGNAKLGATDGIAEVTGPASGGALVAAFGAPLAVVIDAFAYLMSALLLGRIRRPEPPPAPSPSAASSTWQARQDVQVGMRAVFEHPLVRPIVLSLMVWAVAGGFFAALYPLLVMRTLGLPESTYGIIVAVGGIGSLGGALLSRRLVRAIGLGRMLIATAVLSLAAGVLIPLADGSRPMVLAFLCGHQLFGDGFAVAFTIQAVTLRQTVLPTAVLGRANAAILVCTIGILTIAALAAGGLAQLVTIREAVWVGTVIGLLAPALLWPLRHLREMPAGPAA
jgi:MFS family permease